MAVPVSLIPELEDVLQRGSAVRRGETLRRITTLFLDGASRYNDDHVDLFDDVFGYLIIEVETRARAELAHRLALVENAPGKTLLRLAGDDDISVAGPVLAHAKRLDDTDLVTLARIKSQAHLLALSERVGVSEAVTDIIVDRGDADVVRTVADNRGARFSDAGFAALVKRAARDGELAERVGRRHDIPPHMFRRLLMQATDIVQHRLLAAARPETQAEIKRILAKVSEQIGANGAPARDFAMAQREVLSLHRAGRLAERELVKFARDGQYEHAVAALSALCGSPIDVVDRLMSAEQPDPVLILCKAVGFEWPTVQAVLQIPLPSRRISPQFIDTAFANFELLAVATAQRVLRFWQARPDDGSVVA